MGMSTITPTRIHKGQLKGKTGEEDNLAMDTFPYVGISKDWKQEKEMRSIKHSFVWKKDQFDAVDPDTTDYLLGMFAEGHMNYDIDRNNGSDWEPSLTEMTEKAIRILEKNANGFFLLVENGRIDNGHHDSKAVKAIYDTLEFDNAIQKGMELVDEANTLVVVTADHSHVFSMAGSPSKGNPIFSIVDVKPITTRRPDLTKVNTANKDNIFQSAAPFLEETHGGEDVAIFVRGPMAHIFHGVHEQRKSCT